MCLGCECDHMWMWVSNLYLLLLLVCPYKHPESHSSETPWGSKCFLPLGYLLWFMTKLSVRYIIFKKKNPTRASCLERLSYKLHTLFSFLMNSCIFDLETTDSKTKHFFLYIQISLIFLFTDYEKTQKWSYNWIAEGESAFVYELCYFANNALVS